MASRIRWVVLGIAALLLLGRGSAHASPIWFVTYGGSYGSGTAYDSHLWSYDPGIDAFTERGALSGDYWTDIAFGPDGNLYGLKWESHTGNAGLYSIPIDNPGSPTQLVAPTGKDLNAFGWVDGGMLAADTENRLVRFSYESGAWTSREFAAMTASAGDIEKEAGGRIYMAGLDRHFYEIDPADYGLTQKSSTLFDDYIYGLAFDRGTGTYYGFSNKGQLGMTEGDGSLYAIVIGENDVTYTPLVNLEARLGDAHDDVWGATTAPVPIPGALWLCASALAGLTGLRRKAGV